MPAISQNGGSVWQHNDAPCGHKRFGKRAAARLALLAGLFCSSAAYALPAIGFGKVLNLQDGTGNFQIVNRLPDATAPIQGTFGGSFGSASSTDGIIDTSLGPFPTASAFSSFAGSAFGPAYGNQSISTFFYFYQIVGPAQIDVPVIITGRTILSHSGISGAAGLIYLTDESGSRFVDRSIQCSFFNSSGCGNQTFIESFLAPAFLNVDQGISGGVELQAIAGSNTGRPQNQSSAFVDPLIRIDPLFLLNNPGYQLFVSPGAGNGVQQSVPEPESWAMMILGFFMIGGVLRSQCRVKNQLNPL